MEGIFGANWAMGFNQVSGSTYDMIALFAVFGIAYSFVKNEGFEGVPAGMLGLVSLFIISKSSILVNNEVVNAVIPKDYLGGKGIIAAILIGIMVGYIYSWFLAKDIRIKMPESVPEGVANAFTALIPGLVILIISFGIFVLSDIGFNETFVEKIYAVLQTPIQSMLNSVAAIILIPLLISLFWWTGVHGSNLIGGVLGPILLANSMANEAVLKSGEVLVAGQNANIFTQQLLDQFITFGGSGMTVGLVIAMVLFAKSKQYKQLGKLSLVPGIFNINEPIIFGVPMMFNPVMLVPFVIIPILSAVITYFSISFGLITPFAGVIVPWTTPPVISGFLVGGWKAALLQIALIAMAACIYYPFFKVIDKQAFEGEVALD